MRMRLVKSVMIAGLVAFTAGSSWAAGPTVVADAMGSAPTLDGMADEWAGVTGATVKVMPANDGDAKAYQGAVDVQIKAAVNGDMIYVLAQWPDSTKSDTHKTLTWSAEKDGYVEGKDREDRIALKFDMGGEFTACMLTGKEYKADVWHWKAYRSQSAGVAHDKMHVISFEKLKKSKLHPTRDGKEIYVQRPGDKGDKLYKSQKPIDNIGAVVPRYLPNMSATGSVADVKAASSWKDGMWTLELARKLDTGNPDDVVLAKGKTYNAGAAVFDHTGDDHHSTGAWALEIK